MYIETRDFKINFLMIRNTENTIEYPNCPYQILLLATFIKNLAENGAALALAALIRMEGVNFSMDFSGPAGNIIVFYGTSSYSTFYFT